MQAPLVAAMVACAGLALASGLADRRRQRRTDPDRVGWVAWQPIHVAALFATLILAAIAISG